MKTLVRLGSGIAVALVAAAAPAFSDVWNCQLPNHAGLWLTDGGDLVVPSLTGAHRLAIASDTLDSVVALSSMGRHVEIAVIDRRRLQARYQTIELDGVPEQREAGLCALPDRRVAAQAHAAAANVRARVRKQVAEAHNLADQGFSTAANLKLTEAESMERVTPEELALIREMRAYVAAKPRR